MLSFYKKKFNPKLFNPKKKSSVFLPLIIFQ